MITNKVYEYLFCSPLLLTSGGSTDTPKLSAEGHVLLILSAVIQLMVWTVTFVAVAHRILGLSVKYLTMPEIICSCVVEPEKLSCFTAGTTWLQCPQVYGYCSFMVL